MAVRCRVARLLLLLTVAGLLVPLASAAPATATGVAPLAGLSAGDWPQLGGGASHKGFQAHESVLSPATVPGLQGLWSKAFHTDTSSAVVVDGTVYVGAGSTVQALSAADGSVRWSFATSGAVLSPAVSNGLVYVTTADGYLYTLRSATGSLRWRVALGAAATSSPTVADRRVFVGLADGSVAAVSAATGALAWRWAGAADVHWSAPTVNQGKVFVLGTSCLTPGLCADSLLQTLALDETTGARLWALPAAGYFGGPSAELVPAATDTTVFLPTMNLPPAPGPRAVTADAGNTIWVWPAADQHWETSPAVAYGLVYVTNGDRVDAVSSRTGRLRWSTRVPYALGVSVANGVVYSTSPGRTELNGLVALDAMTGALLSTYGMNPAGFFSAPVVAEGRVYVVDHYDGRVIAFGLPNSASPTGAANGQR